MPPFPFTRQIHAPLPRRDLAQSLCAGSTAPWHNRQGSARAPVALSVVVTAFLLAWSGCASPQASAPDAATGPPSAEAAALVALLAGPPNSDGPENRGAGIAVRVRLAFDAGADLDLYVTDSTQETVYFANSPTRVGGRLLEDVRCDDPAPRIETVVFPTARAGSYRVGVDYPEQCEGGAARVAFAVRIEAPGIDDTRAGTAQKGRFDSLFLEVDVAP